MNHTVIEIGYILSPNVKVSTNAARCQGGYIDAVKIKIIHTIRIVECIPHIELIEPEEARTTLFSVTSP